MLEKATSGGDTALSVVPMDLYWIWRQAEGGSSPCVAEKQPGWGFFWGGAVGRRLALSVLESLWAAREGGAAGQTPLKLLFLCLGGSTVL